MTKTSKKACIWKHLWPEGFFSKALRTCVLIQRDSTNSEMNELLLAISPWVKSQSLGNEREPQKKTFSMIHVSQSSNANKPNTVSRRECMHFQKLTEQWKSKTHKQSLSAAPLVGKGGPQVKLDRAGVFWQHSGTESALKPLQARPSNVEPRKRDGSWWGVRWGYEPHYNWGCHSPPEITSL